MPTDLIERELCYSIVGAFFEVYNYYGCGLSESIYASALEPTAAIASSARC
jgi:hypothetical protein